MKTLFVAFIGAVLIAVAPGASAADQRGGGGRQGGGPTAGSGPQKQGPQVSAPKHPDVRQGTQNADRVRERARELERHAAKGDPVQTLTRDRDRIREQIVNMEKAHQRWRDGLSEQDRLRLRDQLRDMEQQQDRLRTHLRDLDTVLAAPSPDRTRIQQLSREIARVTDEWRTAWQEAAQQRPTTGS